MKILSFLPSSFDFCRLSVRLVFGLFVWLAAASPGMAGLKVYYLRHAEGGHNVVDQWRHVPKEQWPAYVGNTGMFTPKGEKQIVAVTGKLQQYKFDYIAVSPVWRARQTVLPYLKETRRIGEIWPELVEFGTAAADLIGSERLPLPNLDLYTGAVIRPPEEEAAWFASRSDGEREMGLPKESLQLAADMRLALERAIEMIRRRFGGSEQSILLVGHGNNGRELLKRLVPELRGEDIGLGNTSLWMAEEQADGSFRLVMLNDRSFRDPEVPAGQPSAAKG